MDDKTKSRASAQRQKSAELYANYKKTGDPQDLYDGHFHEQLAKQIESSGEALDEKRVLGLELGRTASNLETFAGR